MGPTLTWEAIAVRLALTLVAGILIGLDRNEHAHPAGLRTTVLIALAASVAMIQAHWLTLHTVDTHSAIVREDMMRLPLGILSGVGFIGAGVILRRGEMVRGITTAATIWITTVIGLCFGGGQLGLGAAATAMTMAALWAMKFAEHAIVMGRRGTLDVTFATQGARGQTGGQDPIGAHVRTGAQDQIGAREQIGAQVQMGAQEQMGLQVQMGAQEQMGLHEQILYRLLQAHGFALRSRQVEAEADGARRIVCHGRYRGAYPGWSSALVRDVSARPEVIRVSWSDAD